MMVSVTLGCPWPSDSPASCGAYRPSSAGRGGVVVLLWTFRCSVSSLMRAVRMAIWTSGSRCQWGEAVGLDHGRLFVLTDRGKFHLQKFLPKGRTAGGEAPSIWTGCVPQRSGWAVCAYSGNYITIFSCCQRKKTCFVIFFPVSSASPYQTYVLRQGRRSSSPGQLQAGARTEDARRRRRSLRAPPHSWQQARRGPSPLVP